MVSEATANGTKKSSDGINNHMAERQQKQDDSKKLQPPKKVYIERNSVLTDLMEVNHLQSVYNIMVAALNLLLFSSVMYYITAPHMFWDDVYTIGWAASKPLHFIIGWSLCNLYAFLIYGGFKSWAHLRNTINSKVADFLCLVLYIFALIFMFVATAYGALHFAFPPIDGFALSLEQIRIFMKIYGFVRENTPRVLQYKPSKDGDQQVNIIPSISHSLYFLFAPTFIYKDSYPRKKEINWNFAFESLFKFFACIVIAYCFFMRFIVDIFRNIGVRQFTWNEAALIYTGSMFVGASMMFLIFYFILHSWLNFCAELLRFADREFYQDWWNSTSFSQYYRKWNLVVYDWLYTYIYLETQKLGCNRTSSMVIVFLISALFHEYAIGLSLGFFYPVLMIIYSTVGVIVMFITKKRTGQFWNTFMWGMLFSGWGVIVCLYSSEWYARINCPEIYTKGSVQDLFIPRSWSSSCRIFKFS